MYIILNNRLERIGTLSNHSINGTPFYNDQITQQIADDDQEMNLQSVPDTTNAYDPNGNTKNWGHTLNSIFVPYGFPDTDKIAEGNSLAYQDPNNGRWYVMRLTSVSDSTDKSGNHFKEATGVNLLIWKLGKTVHYAETIRNANSRKAFSALLDDTGWYFDPTSELVGGSSDIQFDGQSSSQAMLQQLCHIYGAEIDAYVLFPRSVKINGVNYFSDFHVAMKYVDVERHLGTDNGDRIVYGRNATNIRRTVVDDNLYTRLYVNGKNGATCACEATNNEPYVEDDVANDIYNPALGDNAENYLEGSITSQTMSNPERLAAWGKKQLKIFNHPRANYTVMVSNKMSAGAGQNVVMSANLGDTFRVIDYKMDPVLTAQSRVIRKTLSFANPYQNSITLGEYTTVNVVTPNFINQLRQGEYNRVDEILREIETNPGALTCTIDKPDGCTWHYQEKQKRFIAHVYVLGQDITNMIQPRGYVWQLWQKGQINSDFTNKHSTDGQTLVLNNDIQLDSQATSILNNNTSDQSNSTTSNSSLASSYSWNNADTSASYYNNSSTDSSDDSNDHVYFWDDPPSDGLGSRMLGDDQGSSNNQPSDSSDGVEINGDNIDECLEGPNDVTGEVRLLIDTDYISDQLDTNFNTNRIQHLFTIGDWKDTWGDSRVGAIQYINFDPNNSCYLAAQVYYGRNRPRKNGSLIERTAHSEFSRLDMHGNYEDSMVVLFSHHNSNFGLEYKTAGGPYIWTTIQDYYAPTSRYWLVRIPYQPGQVVSLSDIPMSERVMKYGEPSCMTYYDNSSDMVVFSHDYTPTSPGHKIEFYKRDDLLQNHEHATPVSTIELTDYGFVPKTSGMDSDSSQQTFQSGCLHWPYYYFDSGDVNMSDQRMIYGINVQSGTKIFSKPVDMDLFNLSKSNSVIGNNPGNYVFAEPETLNWIVDDNHNNLWFLYGLNVGYENNRDSDYTFNSEGIPQPDYKHYELLYSVGFDLKNYGYKQPDHSNNGHPNINGGDNQ